MQRQFRKYDPNFYEQKDLDNYRFNKELEREIKKINSMTEWFYSDEFALEEAAAKYKEATTLAKDIEKDLNELKNEIEVLSEDFSK